MIDITEKQPVKRKAVATGRIFLKESTIEKIKNRQIKKGNCLETAKIAGINAVKQTQTLIPYCHQIPIENADFKFTVSDHIEVTCTVKTIAKTGVEIEALVGVTIALNTIWDMVKYLEKNEKGQYPGTRITDIKIIEKWKE